MLLSFVNMKLRDVYPNLHALCNDLDADEREICEKLAQIGYTYSQNRTDFCKKERGTSRALCRLIDRRMLR